MKFFFAILWVLPACISCGCNSSKSDGPQIAENQATYTFGKPSVDGIGKFYFGREISQVMGVGGALWLERDTRQEEENVTLAIEKMNLRPGDIVADIGAGTGYYTFRLAIQVPQGKVYAVEVQEDFVKYLTRKKEQLRINNVEVVQGNVRSPNLPGNSLDLAIMADVYHELDYPGEMLQSIKKALKPPVRFC